MMAAAIEEANARPGMVAVIQTFGSSPSSNSSGRSAASRDTRIYPRLR